MIYFLTFKTPYPCHTKSHKGYRLLIYMVPHDSPLWTSAIYSKHELLHKNNFSCVHCRCVFKDEIENEHLSKSLWEEEKKKTTSWGNKPVYTQAFLSICSWHDVGETRSICVMCRWAFAARPWFKEKQSFYLGNKSCSSFLQLVCMVLIK